MIQLARILTQAYNENSLVFKISVLDVVQSLTQHEDFFLASRLLYIERQ
jgi:hypothetical protein